MINQSFYSFPSEQKHLKDVEELVNSLFKEYTIADDLYGNILLCTMEACNNAIVHGNNNNKELEFTIEFTLSEKLLEITITDQGPGYDYNNLPNPTDPENIDKPTGRGIFLVKSLSDEVEFRNDGTELVLRFNLELDLEGAN